MQSRIKTCAIFVLSQSKQETRKKNKKLKEQNAEIFVEKWYESKIKQTSLTTTYAFIRTRGKLKILKAKGRNELIFQLKGSKAWEGLDRLPTITYRGVAIDERFRRFSQCHWVSG